MKTRILKKKTTHHRDQNSQWTNKLKKKTMINILVLLGRKVQTDIAKVVFYTL